MLRLAVQAAEEGQAQTQCVLRRSQQFGDLEISIRSVRPHQVLIGVECALLNYDASRSVIVTCSIAVATEHPRRERSVGTEKRPLRAHRQRVHSCYSWFNGIAMPMTGVLNEPAKCAFPVSKLIWYTPELLLVVNDANPRASIVVPFRIVL